ncbi:MAG: archaeosine synthase subunit alpha [Candidatus Thermoplasmatota archaeon]|nr:archaeosine synthase subunit alpha [Candidatus Thermoplasmatota archaeon]
MFEILYKDCIARIGKLNDKLIVPNILFISSKRFKEFEGSEALLANEEIKSDKFSILDSGSKFYPQKLKNQEYIIPPDIPYPLSCSELLENYCDEKICLVQDLAKLDKNKKAEIYVVANSIELFKSPKRFVATITNLRDKIGYQKIIYTPSIGLPNQYALLFYLSVDLIDSLQLVLSSRENYFLTPEGKTNIEELEESICNCKYCFENDLLQHNYNIALLELKKIRSEIRAGKLRELVELRIRSDPALVAILRELDYRYYDFQEPYFPITKKSLTVTSRESFFRPDILRWYKRLKERYKKPESSKILLLLPCSAKKPYSQSKSHKIFKSAIRVKNYAVVHEVIVTSPLGIVPRELELFYPAQHYDIPVSGDWEEYEIKIVNELLQWLVKNNHYDVIVDHTGYHFIDLEAIKTCILKPTSKESLSRLSNVLTELCAKYENIAQDTCATDNMLTRACFQFGKPVGDKLVANCKILGKYPNLKLIKGDEQIGILTGERGLISLTLEGAKILADENSYLVKIDDFVPKGNIFAGGVIDATSEIRIGDDVAAVFKNELRAVGVATMSAKEMVESNRGIAVKVRASVRK